MTSYTVTPKTCVQYYNDKLLLFKQTDFATKSIADVTQAFYDDWQDGIAHWWASRLFSQAEQRLARANNLNGRLHQQVYK